MSKSHYDILGISPDATLDEIRRAFVRLVHQWHPDKNKSPKANETFREIKDAFECLRNAKRRAAYDAQRIKAGQNARTEKPKEAPPKESEPPKREPPPQKEAPKQGEKRDGPQKMRYARAAFATIFLFGLIIWIWFPAIKTSIEPPQKLPNVMPSATPQAEPRSRSPEEVEQDRLKAEREDRERLAKLEQDRHDIFEARVKALDEMTEFMLGVRARQVSACTSKLYQGDRCFDLKRGDPYEVGYAVGDRDEDPNFRERVEIWIAVDEWRIELIRNRALLPSSTLPRDYRTYMTMEPPNRVAAWHGFLMFSTDLSWVEDCRFVGSRSTQKNGNSYEYDDVSNARTVRIIYRVKPLQGFLIAENSWQDTFKR